MAAIQPMTFGIASGTKGVSPYDPKIDSEHIERVEQSASADYTTATEQDDKFTSIETEAYVVEKVHADFQLVPIILDEVRPDEVLVEMKYSGVYVVIYPPGHTDMVTQHGGLPMVDFPAIFGHEGAGVVRHVGRDVRVKGLRVGDSVLLSINSCGACDTCASGHPALCPDSSRINVGSVRTSDRSTPARLAATGQPVRSQFFGHSSFSRMSVVSEKSVVRCPEGAAERMDVYAPLGCGLQTGAGTVMNVIKPCKEDSIVIFGLGSVGLAALMAAKYLEVGQIVAVDIVPGRLALAKEVGATHTINSRESADIIRDIQSATSGGPKYAIDCTGVLNVIEDIIACVRPLGTAVLVGVPPPAADIKIDAQAFLLANKRLVGVIEGDSLPSEFIPKLISMHQEGKFPIDKLCKTYPATELKQAMQDMKSGEASHQTSN
ncbi:Aryl-alcohol dehydrogenase [Colletotrichum trifolii]|uniref:Aryl-alcohol dehydrogenase n=1 Tax=Colletotrichum trifolii TaxID=5466 RepID=A0A4R8RV94_COLTR|nr:Aryl-alcohol dehydrogenase [Colletotrichum trifolii]